MVMYLAHRERVWASLTLFTEYLEDVLMEARMRVCAWIKPLRPISAP